MKQETKRGLFATTVLAGLAITMPSLAQAPVQTTPAPAPAATEDEDVVIVTGSRIARPNQDAPTAVAVFSSDTIDNTGASNIADILRTLPAAGVSAISASNSNFSTAGNGINTVDLRNLGEDRTLVLVNGRRFVSGVPGTQIVDFNTIPTDFIDRVEVITGGASAVYGSDALAGVVNVILKNNFEGVKFTAQGGSSLDYGDDERYKATLTLGSSFADGKGHAATSFTYDVNNGVNARNRPTTDGDYTWNFPATGDLASFVGPAFSSYIPQGNIRLPTQAGTEIGRVVQDDGSITSFVSARDGFNRNAQRVLLVPTKRMLASSVINYEIAPVAEVFAELTYARTESTSTLEPVPYDSSQAYGDQLVFCGDPDDPAFTGFDCTGTGVPLTNPLIPAAIANAVRAEFPGVADAQLAVGFRRRLNEIDFRGNDGDRDTVRGSMGVRGDFLDERFNYEVSLTYGRTSDFQTSRGDVNSTRFAQALDAITDGSGNVVCRDPAAVAAGCVPINIFGRNKISGAAANYVQIQTSRFQEAEQTAVNGFISGDAFNLPAGPVEFVLGSEYRDERSSDIPDPLTQSGEASGNATPPTIGAFNVKEAFAELRIPVLKDLPFVRSLDVNLAGRVSEYSTVGSTDAYAGSVEYSPFDSLKFRAQLSRAVRAPNVSELYQPLSQDFPNVTDPCSGLTRTGGGQAAFRTNRTGGSTFDQAAIIASPIDAATIGSQAAVNCLADPTVAARVARDGTFALGQNEVQGVSGFDGGSTALDAETGDTFSIGLVFNPDWGKWWNALSVSVDYFDIKITDVISVIGEQTSADNCYTTASSFQPTSTFCSNIVRFATGPSLGALRYVNQQNQNLGEKTTSGIDIQASYGFDLNDVFSGVDLKLGELSFGLIWSHLLELQTVPFIGADPDQYIDDKGTIGAAEDEATLNVGYTRGNLRVSWDVQYIGASVVTNDEDNTEDYGTTIGGKFIRAEVDQQFFHDIQARYNVSDNFEVFFGVDNLLDEYVQFGGTQVPPGPDGKPTGWSTYPDVYDGLRRRGYAGVRLTF